MKWRWLGYGLIATPILALVSFLALGYWMFAQRFEPQPVRDFATLTEWTQLEFPSQAKLIDGVGKGPMTFTMVAKVEMTHSQISEFITQPTLKNAEVSRKKFSDDYSSAAYSMKELKGWTLPKPKRFICLGRYYESAARLWTLIDLDNPQTAVLYLYYVN